jgi:hypothetical protein
MALFKTLASFLPETREATAKRVNGLMANVKADVDRQESMRKLMAAASSRRRFERCFALEVIGRLGDYALSAVPLQIEGMLDDDPFVREAAASSTLRLLSKSVARTFRHERHLEHALVNVILAHVSEGAAHHAVGILSLLNPRPSDSLLEALEYASLAPKSSTKKEAKALYARIKGDQPRPIPPAPERVGVILAAFQSNSDESRQEGLRVLRYTEFNNDIGVAMQQLLSAKHTASSIKAKAVTILAEKPSVDVAKYLEIVTEDQQQAKTVRFAAALGLAKQQRRVKHRRSKYVIIKIMPELTGKQQAEIRAAMLRY